MELKILDNKSDLGKESAKDAIFKILQSISKHGSANIILATGASQFETVKNLASNREIDWSKVVMFHLDEYVGLPKSHPASFRNYLQKRFVDLVPDLKAVHFIEGDSPDPESESARISKIISDHPIDVALVGIGENGHLAFNDPPADFQTEEPFIVVELDEACRKQQMGEGWFTSFEHVPKKAISMSINHIMKSEYIICSVPEKRKAIAVKNCLEKKVSPNYPASILREHPQCTLYLDQDSSFLLSDKTIADFLTD